MLGNQLTLFFGQYIFRADTVRPYNRWEHQGIDVLDAGGNFAAICQNDYDGLAFLRPRSGRCGWLPEVRQDAGSEGICHFFNSDFFHKILSFQPEKKAFGRRQKY